MPEPTVQDVLGGFETKLDDGDVEDYIDDAGVMLRNAYAADELPDTTDTTLWKYLTRHLIRHEPDRQSEQKSVGGAQKQHSGSFGTGLQGTSPGQAALALDPDGKLTQLGSPNDETFFRSL